MELSEKDIELIIFENKNKIHEKGFIHFFKNTERQFRLPTGQIMDIFSWELTEEKFRAIIVEIKKDKIGIEAATQALCYWEEIVLECLGRVDMEISIVLVGSLVCPILETYISNGLRINCFSYSYGYDGISFKEVVGPCVNFEKKDNLHNVLNNATLLSKLK